MSSRAPVSIVLFIKVDVPGGAAAVVERVMLRGTRVGVPAAAPQVDDGRRRRG